MISGRCQPIILCLAVLLVLTGGANACPVCFNADEDTRSAYVVTTVVMSALPLGMIGGLAFFFRWQLKDTDDSGLGS